MKVEATSLEAVHTRTHTHTTHLANKKIKNKISKSIKDSNSLNKF